jgi:hypothetical protein
MPHSPVDGGRVVVGGRQSLFELLVDSQPLVFEVKGKSF